MASLQTPNQSRQLSAMTPKSPRSPGRALRTPSAQQQYIPPPTNFAPPLTTTVFANDAAFRQTLNQDLANVDFALRQLLSAKAERRRAHEMDLHDLTEEGKRIELDRSRLQDAAKAVSGALERERSEVTAAQSVIRDLDARKADMASQLELLRADMKEWQSKIENVRSKNLKLQQEASKKQSSNAKKVAILGNACSLSIQGQGPDKISFTFKHLNPAAFDQPYTFHLDLSTQMYSMPYCSPSIVTSSAAQLLDTLNTTRDLARFIKSMRNAFIATLPPNASTMRQEAMRT